MNSEYKHIEGCESFKKAKLDGKSQLEAIYAFFNAEPVAKQGVKECKFYKGLQNKRISVDETIKIIKSEEEKYISMLDNAGAIIRKVVKNVEKIDGELLSTIHHTYGYDPTVVEDILETEFPSSVHDAYLIAYDVHRSKSKLKVQ